MNKEILEIKDILRRSIKSSTENINNGYFESPEATIKALNSRRADMATLLVIDLSHVLFLIACLDLGIRSFIKLTNTD